MSAELLRRAAAQIRTAAEAAQKEYASPWHDDGDAVLDPTGTTVADVYDDGQINYLTEHIASWHPVVALAVADALEEDAQAWDEIVAQGITPEPSQLVTVARVYLGGTS